MSCHIFVHITEKITTIELRQPILEDLLEAAM